jgi:hypothetical protein
MSFFKFAFTLDCKVRFRIPAYKILVFNVLLCGYLHTTENLRHMHSVHVNRNMHRNAGT